VTHHCGRSHTAEDGDKEQRIKNEDLKDKISITDRQGEKKSQRTFYSRSWKGMGRNPQEYGVTEAN